MKDKIEIQYERGKPVVENDKLHWLKGEKENLLDIMNDLEVLLWNVEY